MRTRALLVLALLVGNLSAVSGQGTVMPVPRMQFFDTSGNVCAGCKLYHYTAGTTTTQAAYSEVTLTTAHAQPVVLDAGGRAAIFLSATSYRFDLYSAADVLIWSQDNVAAVPTTAGNVDITGTAGVAIALGEVVYLSDGSGGLTAGRWYLADADLNYGSTRAGLVGIATQAISSAASGTIRLAGRMTGLSGLTAGSVYYASATAGALTATAPTNARVIGKADSTTTLVFPDVSHASIVERKLTINAATPYDLTLPSADADGYLKSDGSGTVSLSGFATEQTTTSTGTVNNFARTNARYVILHCNNASLLTITGFATAGTAGDVVDIISDNAQVDLAHNSGASTGKFNNFATSAATSLEAGSGRARYISNGTVWQLVSHEQGSGITVTYAAGNFTASGGAWTVDAGDQTAFRYWLRGTALTVVFDINSTDVAVASQSLIITMPGGFSAVGVPYGGQVHGTDAAANAPAYCVAQGTSMYIRIDSGANWSVTAGDNTSVRSTCVFEVS